MIVKSPRLGVDMSCCIRTSTILGFGKDGNGKLAKYFRTSSWGTSEHRMERMRMRQIGVSTFVWLIWSLFSGTDHGLFDF